MSSAEFSSDEIRSVKFREKLKGYHPEEVDALLDRAARALDELNAQLEQANSRALEAEAAVAGHSEADESLRKTLVLAQRTVDLAIREAKEEARQIREEAEADAARIREQVEAEATALRAEAEQVRAAAEERASSTLDEADALAEARLLEVAEQIEAAEAEAGAARDRARAEARRESEEGVRSLLGQQQQLRADVETLAQFLAGERARVLDVLMAAVERFGETLAPSAPTDGPEIDRSLDREGLVEGTVDPAAEDSWNFDPTVLNQPENQWWSSPTEGSDPPPEWFSAAGPASTPPEAPAPDTPSDLSGPHRSDPEDAPGAGPAPEDEPPARLLFILEDENRR